MSTPTRPSPVAADAPLTLTEAPPRTLGLRDSLGLWGNLGISLLLPVAAVYVVMPGRSLWVTIGAIVVGAVIGAALLGATAAAGAREQVPAMVLLRGLLGRHSSYLPTALNLVQCVGWATFEIVIIAEAASRVLDAPRWPFVLGAGVLATAMALRPLGVVRVLARYAVWAALAALVYLYVQVLREPLPELTEGSASSFWTAADIVIALPVSWIPLAADYSRHVRSSRAAGVGASVGYGVATVVMFTLGVLALAAYGSAGLDVIDALLVVPLGALAVLLLVVVELDEAFANLYSTAVSAQNVVARADRRVLVLVVGAVATLLALTFDIAAYEPFLFLIGAVFVPLAGVFLVAYWLLPRGTWDTSDTAPARLELLLPWVAGFVAYQLTLPTYFAGPGAGWTSWWTERQTDLGIDPANGWSASLVSLAVAVLLTLVVRAPALVRGRRS
ncbi:purine-cytosine permease family protein [Modestobacter roseus]|uniref:Putative hydroxymethylpyrimidine transporter CytX n=1 Tax=Modestobacter roseus TaxID=1181884 RepID=A0A562IW24_9ACTN|nr:cytosine permease [Modestobacter roseus]MQA35894.1 cytosine permease [Modestobacter roseus]TWH75046.1 putative hydroxymethylpyrimidine transporter CytX [Modestobacter roseus]